MVEIYKSDLKKVPPMNVEAHFTKQRSTNSSISTLRFANWKPKLDQILLNGTQTIPQTLLRYLHFTHLLKKQYFLKYLKFVQQKPYKNFLIGC